MVRQDMALWRYCLMVLIDSRCKSNLNFPEQGRVINEDFAIHFTLMNEVILLACIYL